jgi:hypothetical protein
MMAECSNRRKILRTVSIFDYGSQALYFVDIDTVIFSMNPRIVPFPVWRTRRDPPPAKAEAKRPQPALIVRLDGRFDARDRGPAPGPSAA